MAEYDVAVVGGSLAGTTTATLLARQGLQVALLERHRNPETHKVLCTHFIQQGAIPTLRRLGLDERIQAAGGVYNCFRVWTRWGWIEPSFAAGCGYNIPRSKLDPLVRELAAETPGVEFIPGQTVTGLLDDDGAAAGVRMRGTDRKERELYARLVVGADGHKSTVARLAATKHKVTPNERFYCLGYYTGVQLASARSGLWFLDPDFAFVLPNGDGVTLLAVMASKHRLPAFREDREAALLAFQRSLPDAPGLDEARLVSKVAITTDYPLVSRAPVPAPGVALVGDAALTSDPVPAVGCGWAFETGAWLADAAGPALSGHGSLKAALRRYHRRHRAVRNHHFLIADWASARTLNPVERLLFSAATRDQRIADDFEAFASRRVPVRRMFRPGGLARAAWINLRHDRGRASADDRSAVRSAP